MRFGCCVTTDSMRAAAAAGYDYVALPVAAVMPERPEAEFGPVREELLAAPIKPEAWHSLLPSDLRVTGPDVDWPRLARYAHTALRRIADVGGAVVAFDSGTCRRAPAGFPVDEALDQATEFLRVCGEMARGRGLVIGIEPLSSGSCNLITSLPDAVQVARTVNLPEVGVLPDALEMALDGHSPLDVVDAAAWLTHVRVPPPGSSALQEEWEGEFYDALQMADYDWLISVRSERLDAAGMAAAVDSLRRRFERVESSAHGV